MSGTRCTSQGRLLSKVRASLSLLTLLHCWLCIYLDLELRERSHKRIAFAHRGCASRNRGLLNIIRIQELLYPLTAYLETTPLRETYPSTLSRNTFSNTQPISTWPAHDHQTMLNYHSLHNQQTAPHSTPTPIHPPWQPPHRTAPASHPTK